MHKKLHKRLPARVDRWLGPSILLCSLLAASAWAEETSGKAAKGEGQNVGQSQRAPAVDNARDKAPTAGGAPSEGMSSEHAQDHAGTKDSERETRDRQNRRGAPEITTTVSQPGRNTSKDHAAEPQPRTPTPIGTHDDVPSPPAANSPGVVSETRPNFKDLESSRRQPPQAPPPVVMRNALGIPVAPRTDFKGGSAAPPAVTRGEGGAAAAPASGGVKAVPSANKVAAASHGGIDGAALIRPAYAPSGLGGPAKNVTGINGTTLSRKH
jgi:hypothetical protein